MPQSTCPRQILPRGIQVAPTRRVLLALLRQLQRHHVLLRLRESGLQPGQQPAWQTLLLEVDPAGGDLLIDEPFPADCPLAAGAVLQLSAAVGGDRRLAFRAGLRQRTAAGWRLTPAEPDIALQRRYADRIDGDGVTRRDGEPWCAEFRDGDRYYAAVVDDLSLTGIRLRMSGPFLPSLRRGGRLRELRFTLDGHRFMRHGSVCHATVDQDGELQLGCALDVAPAADDTLLDRVIQRRLR